MSSNTKEGNKELMENYYKNSISLSLFSVGVSTLGDYSKIKSVKNQKIKPENVEESKEKIIEIKDKNADKLARSIIIGMKFNMKDTTLK
mmetsp:Transcript_29094/g.25734  ORF Transcript_29094/g.25734 Transcript_29094/m.25734 type:complete len:89 (+) Transcript_29094:1-267(+)